MEEQSLIIKKNELAQIMSDIEIRPFIPKENTAFDKHIKIPLDKIATLGVGFEPIMQGLKAVGANGGEQLYRVELGKGANLVTSKDGKLLGVATKNGKFTKPAILAPVSGGGVPPINPVMIGIAIILLSVNKKLDQICETQAAILAFLEEKERARQEGNLEVLSDIFNNYKYNWDNQMYKTNKHLQVQEIKRDAEQNIKFYRSKIEKRISKKSILHSDRGVETKMKDIEAIYKNYQLALYLYAFAYFLEVMLFENYESRYLENVAKTIVARCEEYKSLYQKAYNAVEEYSKTSIQTCAVKALSWLSKETGEAVAEIPLINKSQLDENLIKGGIKLNKKSIERTEKTVERLFNGETDFVLPFLENIHSVNKFYNEPLGFLMDKEYLYIEA